MLLGQNKFLANLTSSDNGIHWTGTVDISGLSEGQAEFIPITAIYIKLRHLCKSKDGSSCKRGVLRRCEDRAQ